MPTHQCVGSLIDHLVDILKRGFTGNSSPLQSVVLFETAGIHSLLTTGGDWPDISLGMVTARVLVGCAAGLEALRAVCLQTFLCGFQLREATPFLLDQEIFGAADRPG
jgi:hypothetical protein